MNVTAPYLMLFVFSDVVKLEDGIGEKLATFIFYQASFISSVIMALVKGWKLALLCLISFPVTMTLVGVAGLVRLVTTFLDGTLWPDNGTTRSPITYGQLFVRISSPGWLLKSPTSWCVYICDPTGLFLWNHQCRNINYHLTCYVYKVLAVSFQ